ncbi:MAG: hypothetical protein V1663_02020 [archaeon]
MSEAKRWWVIAIVLFLAMGFFSALGFYDRFYYSNNNKISTMASSSYSGVSGTLGNSIEMLRDTLRPIFQAIGHDNEGIFIRIFLFIILYIIIAGALKLVFSGNGGRISVPEKQSNIIAALVSLASVSFLPDELMRGLGPTLGSILFSVFIIFGLGFIYKIDKDREDGFTHWKKALFCLLMILIIALFTSMSGDWFNTGPVNGIAGTISGLATAILTLSMIYYIFSGGVGSKVSSTTSNAYQGFVDKGGVRGVPPRVKKNWWDFWGRGQPQQAGSGPQAGPSAGPGKAAIKKEILNMYSTMKNIDRNIENEFSKNPPNQNNIETNLKAMISFCREIITILENPSAISSGIDEKSRRNVVALSKSVSTRCETILRTGEFNRWLGLYMSYIGRRNGVLANIEPLINAL